MMSKKLITTNTIKLSINHVLKLIEFLPAREKKNIVQYIQQSIKYIIKAVKPNRRKNKQTNYLFSKFVATCKTDNGEKKSVIRRKNFQWSAGTCEKQEHFDDDNFDCSNSLDLENEINYSPEDKSYSDVPVLKNDMYKEELNNDNLINTELIRQVNYNIPCSLCNHVSNSHLNIAAHIYNHGGSQISCMKCKHTYNNLSIFRIHLNEDCTQYKNLTLNNLLDHLSNIIKIKGQKYLCGFHCPYCDLNFVKPFNLKRHLKNICGENKAAYHCTMCNKKFNHEVKYSEHLQQHSNYKCLNCDLYFPSKKLLKQHSHIHPKVPKRKYKCELCCIEFTNRVEYRNHNKVHTGDKNLTPAEKSWRVWCNACHISFFDYFTYKRHCSRKSHLSKVTDDKELLNMKTFMCVKCGQVFMTKDALSTHCSRIHSNKEKLLCDKCSYTTTFKVNMKRHKETHNENVTKKFFCHQCPSSFMTSSSLKEHINSVHVEERNFACDICQKSFKLKKLLVRHKSIHDPALPFVCVYCTVGFKRKSHLKRHTESRHKERLTKSSVQAKEDIIQGTLGNDKMIQLPSLPIDIKDVSENIQNDRVYSLIDAQSGELVTLSATELSKNDLINMTNNELLNDVHITELWTNSNTMYNLDPIIHNDVLQQPDYNIIAHDKNELLQKTLDSGNQKDNVQYCVDPIQNVESQRDHMKYYYI